MKQLILSSAAALGIFTAHLSAQSQAPAIPVQRSQGMFTGHSLGLQYVNDNSSQQVNPELQIRVEGIGPSVPPVTNTLVVWNSTDFGASGVGHPDYSPQALFGHWAHTLVGDPTWNPNNPAHVPELGGMSTGGDVCPHVNSIGELQMSGPDIAWYILSFTVDQGAVGATGSSIYQANQAAGNAAGHVISYGVEGSAGIRAEFIDTTRVEYTRNQIGLPSTPASADFAISALDWGMGLISSTPGQGPSSLQPVRESFYFTIAARWIDSHWFPNPIVGSSLVNPNTVYFMEWDGSSWSAPGVAFTPQELFGVSEAEIGLNTEIDGLSIFMTPTGTPARPLRAVFSLSTASRLNNQVMNQILVTQRHPLPASAPIPSWPEVEALPLSTQAASPNPNGVLISDKIGLSAGQTGDPDNVRGLCGRDPKEIGMRDGAVGYPVGEGSGGSGQSNLGVSMLRYGDGSNPSTPQGKLLLQASGIDDIPYDLGILVFQLEVYDTSVSNSLALASVETAPVAVLPGQQTEMVTFPVSLPPTLLGPNMELRARAVLHGWNLSPWLIQMRVRSSWTSVISIR